MSRGLWLARRMVLPFSFRSVSRRRASSAPVSSRPFIGSSRIKSEGSSMIAWAMPRRLAHAQAVFGHPLVAVGIQAARLHRGADLLIAGTAGNIGQVFEVFVAAGVGQKAGHLDDGAHVRRPFPVPCRCGGRPHTPRPNPGRRRPATHFISTVLPEPLRPTKPCTRPRSKSTVISSSTFCPAYVLLTFFSSIISESPFSCSGAPKGTQRGRTAPPERQTHTTPAAGPRRRHSPAWSRG